VRGNFARLRYVACHTAHTTGMVATRAVYRAAERLPAADPASKELLRDNPLPLRPGQAELPAARAKDLVKAFLDLYFNFDPNEHVRSAKDPKSDYKDKIAAQNAAQGACFDAADPQVLTFRALTQRAPLPADWDAADLAALAALRRLPEGARRDLVKLLLAKRQGLKGSNPSLDAFHDMSEALYLAEKSPERFAEQLAPLRFDTPARTATEHVPPQDTYHRMRFYMDANYDALRAITDALYCESSMVDKCIYPLTVLEGTPDEISKKFKEYTAEHCKEFISGVLCLNFGQWNVLTETEGNRNRIDIENPDTVVLKRILDRHAADEQAGRELMKNRIRKEKAKNIATDGPDAPGLESYRATVADSKQGDAGMSTKERALLAKAQGDLTRFRELQNIEALEDRIKSLETLEARLAQSGGKLTPNETLDLKSVRDELKQAIEQAAVPDGFIQLDGFVNDTVSNTMTKQSYFIPAEKPDERSVSVVASGVGPVGGAQQPAAGARPH